MAQPSGRASTLEGSAGSAAQMQRDRAGPAETPDYDDRERGIRIKRKPAGPPLAPANRERTREGPPSADDLGEPVDPS
jgi:hypothetical protein